MGHAAILRLADDLEVRLALQDRAHADANKGVVVDDQDPDPFADRAPVGAAPPTVGSTIRHRLPTS